MDTDRPQIPDEIRKMFEAVPVESELERKQPERDSHCYLGLESDKILKS